MPVAAVASIVAGASTLAAGAGVMGTIAAIGGIVGGIGSLTKSKELTALGAVAGLAGGFGAFAQSQGWLASSSAAATAAGGGAPSGIEAMTNAASGAEAASPTAGLAPSVDAGASAAPNLAQQEAQGLFNADKLNPLAASDGAATAGLTSTTTDMTSQANPLADGATFNAAKDSQLANATFGIGPSTTLTGPASNRGVLGVLGDFGQWVEKNKTLSSVAASFIGGAFDSNKRAQTKLLETRAQIEANQAANANAVPNFGFTTNQPAGGVFRNTAPTYTPVRVAGLYNAR